MKRIFHMVTKTSGMVAWNINNKVVIIDNVHFHSLAKALLKDHADERSITIFTLGVTTHFKMGGENEAYRLQTILNDKILDKFTKSAGEFSYKMSGQAARENFMIF